MPSTVRVKLKAENFSFICRFFFSGRAVCPCFYIQTDIFKYVSYFILYIVLCCGCSVHVYLRRLFNMPSKNDFNCNNGKVWNSAMECCIYNYMQLTMLRNAALKTLLHVKIFLKNVAYCNIHNNYYTGVGSQAFDQFEVMVHRESCTILCCTWYNYLQSWCFSDVVIHICQQVPSPTRRAL